jgi:hypothetical protein
VDEVTNDSEKLRTAERVRRIKTKVIIKSISFVSGDLIVSKLNNRKSLPSITEKAVFISDVIART